MVFSSLDSLQSAPAAMHEFALAPFNYVGKLETDQNIRYLGNLI